MGAGSPVEAVESLLAEMKETLVSYTGEAGELIELFLSTTREKQQEWMADVGDKLIAEATAAPGAARAQLEATGVVVHENFKDPTVSLGQVAIPVADFLGAGLAVALDWLKFQLVEVGGALGQLAAEIGDDLSRESVYGLLRTMDQMVSQWISQYPSPSSVSRHVVDTR